MSKKTKIKLKKNNFENKGICLVFYETKYINKDVYFSYCLYD